MWKDMFKVWAKYNKAANGKMDSVIKTLSPQEWDKSLGGFYKSVRRICSHLYGSDFNWLKQFSGIRDFVVFKDPFFNRERYDNFKEILFDDMGEYLASRPVLDEKIIAFADEIEERDLNCLIKYTDFRGNSYEQKFYGLFMHSLNHATHNRGMISHCLELLGKDNDYSSLRLIL